MQGRGREGGTGQEGGGMGRREGVRREEDRAGKTVTVEGVMGGD